MQKAEDKNMPYQHKINGKLFQKNGIQPLTPHPIIMSPLQFGGYVNNHFNKPEEKERNRKRENTHNIVPNKVLVVSKSTKEFQSPKEIIKNKIKEYQENIPNEQKESKKQNKYYESLNQKLDNLEAFLQSLDEAFTKKQQIIKKVYDKQRKQHLKSLQKQKKNKKMQKKEDLKNYITQESPPTHKMLQKITTDPYSPKNNKYYVSEVIKYYKNQNSIVREHLQASIQTLKIFLKKPLPSQQQVNQKIIINPKRAGFEYKKTVVFDLDETLIHCYDDLKKTNDFVINIKVPNGEILNVGINVRPHTIETLQALSKNFELILFTASHSFYANAVLQKIDPRNEYFHYRYYREHCIYTSEGAYIKDLRVINRDLSEVVLVDNAAYSYAFQIENAVPILPYYEGKEDFQLSALRKYLEPLTLQKDVREVNKHFFQLHRYTEFDDVENLVKILYLQMQ